ncbi:MAG: hypothetical protein LBI56_02110 [Puniceicoccales bacterium]|nr:hypothetical protein [Puniceicoccales bacterium]
MGAEISQEETDEKIIPYRNTSNDGIYFKASQVPPMPSEVLRKENRERRKELFGRLSDPLTSEISVLRDKIEMGDFDSEDEKEEIKFEIKRLYRVRRDIREEIKADFLTNFE